MDFLRNSLKQIIAGMIIIVLPLCIYLFSHSSPKRLIRADLFCKGHFIGAFTTDVYKEDIDYVYGQLYSCKNPSIGSQHYAFTKKNGFWYINWNGTGDC